jgi:abortive infection bacteriophage resistance protein
VEKNSLKPALSISKQLELLKNKNLIIDNEEEAYQFLNENNYYRLNIYFHKLMDSKDHFVTGTRFSKIIQLYGYDRFLRHHMFSLLEFIEIEFKSKIANFLALKYGPDVFYKKELYKSSWKYEQISNSFWKEISRNENDPVILHHYNQYSGYFPIWVIVEFLSFNCISKFYANLQGSDQKEIAKTGYGINERYLGNWIHSLSVIRNICAHYGYLYKREFTVPISFGFDTKKFKNQENSLFGVFYCLHKISKNDRWARFYLNVCSKIPKSELIELYHFPSDISDLEE